MRERPLQRTTSNTHRKVHRQPESTKHADIWKALGKSPKGPILRTQSLPKTDGRTLTEANPNARELVTEILDEKDWWSDLNLIVDFLRAKTVQQVRVEFGFVLDHDLAGKRKPPKQIVELMDLERVMRTGLQEGTIEWSGSSDFLFYPLGTELAFMLCNDADLHFASADSSLLAELGRTLRLSGVKVYDSGRLI